MKKVVVNLNFDDFHPQKSRYGDFGGDTESGNFFLIRKLIRDYPNVVVTMFTTPNWIDCPYVLPHWYYKLRAVAGVRPVVRPQKSEPYRLDKHPKWCEVVSSLVEKNNLELAVHGYHHYNPNQTVHGQEFSSLDYKTSLDRIKKAEQVFEVSGLKYRKIFRPPGWGQTGALICALQDCQYKVYAPYPSNYRLSVPGEMGGLFTPPQNWSISDDVGLGLELAEKTGVLFIKGHIAYNHGREVIGNGLSKENWLNLNHMLRLLLDKFDIEFVSLWDFYLRHQK